MPSRDQMLSRATAALKARVTNLEVPWSSQGWSRAWGRAPSDRAPPSAPARRRPLLLACPDASHAANGEAPADTVRGETRERAAEPLGTHRGGAAGIMAPPPRPRAHAHAAPGPSGPGGDVQRRGACPLEGWPEVFFHWCSMGGRQIGGVRTVDFCRFGFWSPGARWVSETVYRVRPYSRSWAAAATDSFRV